MMFTYYMAIKTVIAVKVTSTDTQKVTIAAMHKLQAI